MKIPVYNCIIDESVDDNTGVYAISFVDFPANEVDFVTLNKNTPVFLNKNTQKQILTGVVLKPEQLIYRFSEQLGEYYIKFSSSEIEKISHKMMKTGIALSTTTHQHEKPLEGNYLVELWIVENPANDKSNALGFKDLPKGTLMCSYKVTNEYWLKNVVTENVKGFSLEGLFMQEINMSKLNKSSMNKKKMKLTLVQRLALSALGVKLSDIDAIEKEDTTDSGDTFVEFTLLDGKIVLVDSDNFATMEGEQMQAGEHKLADGNIMVIDENGNFVETKEPSTTVADPEETTATQELKHRLAKEKAKNKSKQKLSDEGGDNTDTDTVESLKVKIAELEKKLSELTGLADEAVKEVENLRKRTPSIPPVVQPVKKVDMSKMSHSDRIAHSATLAMHRKKK